MWTTPIQLPFEKFTQLTRLSYNGFRPVPNQITFLTNLVVLDISQSSIDPNLFLSFNKLQQLDVSFVDDMRNQMDVITKLENLRIVACEERNQLHRRYHFYPLDTIRKLVNASLKPIKWVNYLVT